MIITGDVEVTNPGNKDKRAMNVFLSKIASLKLQEKEVGISRHLPFSHLAKNDIVRTKNGDYLVVLKVEGISCDTLEDEDVNFEQSLREKLFSGFSDPRFAIYHTIIRSHTKAKFSEKFDAPLAENLNRDYNQTINEDALFGNDLYLTILLKGSGSKGNRITSRFNQWISSCFYGLQPKQAEEFHEEAIKTLNESVMRFISGLDKYRIRKLSVIPDTVSLANISFSESLQFFSRILNWNCDPTLVMPAEISRYLPRRRLFFGSRGIESQGNSENDSRFAAMLSLKEYPSATYPGILDYMLELPIEMVVTQSFVFQNRQDSREALELQLRRLRHSRDPDQKGILILEEALGDLVAGEFGFGYHHFTVMVLGESLDKLEKNISEVEKRLAECGIVAVRERLNNEAAFWAQFPGNFRYIARKMTVTTSNLASLCSLQNYPRGKSEGNHWGNAIALLKTPGNQPYYFNFHKPGSDVGHTLILGATGSGKTLLTCFLIANALKFNTRVFYFDKDHGAEAFMRSLGANYSLIGNGHCTGFNPLQLTDSPRNRRFLKTWLSSLLTAFGETLTSEDMDVIHQAVRLNYENLSAEQRTLKNLSEAFGVGGPGTLRNRIEKWHSDGGFAEFFGAGEDKLRFDNPYCCFETGHLLDKANDLIRPSILLYIFHRIQLSLDESPQHSPTIICLDEAWAMLDNPLFAANIRNWLKTFRKRNAIVILLSQEITDISQSEISASIHAETVTKIFFPDASPMKETYRDVFHLAEREINLLKAYSGDKRYFLIKQPQESVFASLDMSKLLQWIPLLSGNSDTVKLLHQLLRQHGDDPVDWLSSYLEKSKNVKKK
jgi:type IV secretion system protein VirB4